MLISKLALTIFVILTLSYELELGNNLLVLQNFRLGNIEIKHVDGFENEMGKLLSHDALDKSIRKNIGK